MYKLLSFFYVVSLLSKTRDPLEALHVRLLNQPEKDLSILLNEARMLVATIEAERDKRGPVFKGVK